MIAKRYPDPGFTRIELLVVLLVLAFSGFAVALAINSFATPLPWYAWPFSFLVLPSAALAVHVLLTRGAVRDD